MAKNQRQRRPGEYEGQRQAKISPGPRIADGAAPAQLMIDKLGQRISRKKSFDHHFGQLHRQPSFRDASADFVIVREIVHNRLEAADGLEITSPESQRGTQSKTYAAFKLSCR